MILDLLNKHPKKVTLQYLDENSGKIVEAVQEIIYDNLPLNCTCCRRQGHDENTCRLIATRNRNNALNMETEDCDDQASGEKFQGDLRQILNERRKLHGDIDAAITDGNNGQLQVIKTGNNRGLVLKENNIEQQLKSQPVGGQKAIIVHKDKVLNQAANVVSVGDASKIDKGLPNLHMMFLIVHLSDDFQ